MGMDAHRAPDVFVALGDRAHTVELVEPRADGQHARDAGRPGTRQHACLVAREFGEVEMAVAIDQHHAAFGVSTNRGKTPCGFGSVMPDWSSLSKAANPLPSAGTASWSRILAVDSGMNGWTSSVTRRMVSASTHSTVSRRAGSVLASAQGACASTYRLASPITSQIAMSARWKAWSSSSVRTIANSALARSSKALSAACSAPLAGTFSPQFLATIGSTPWQRLP